MEGTIMKDLERMAAELFHSYARMEGKSVDWEYLSPERKKAWIRDTMVMARYFMVQLQKEIKPMPNRATHITTKLILTSYLFQKPKENLLKFIMPTETQ